MYALAIAAATSITWALYVVTSPAHWPFENRAQAREVVRLIGLMILWGVVASAFISLLLPSPWA